MQSTNLRLRQKNELAVAAMIMDAVFWKRNLEALVSVGHTRVSRLVPAKKVALPASASNLT